MRSSDGVTVFHGSGLSGGRALAEALEDLDGTGELPVTDELEQAFQETAETCNFQFLPAYADGTFSDPNAVLTWMYRTLSGRSCLYHGGRGPVDRHLVCRGSVGKRLYRGLSPVGGREPLCAPQRLRRALEL